MRDFRTDFCLPAMSGLTAAQCVKIGLALDCAIAYGALEMLDGNESLLDPPALAAAYADKVARLKRL
jgi:hypothetical protein